MAETFKQYKQRIFSYVGKQDPLKVQAATPAKLERLFRGVPRKRLVHRPARGKWSPAEIAAHLADTELVMGWRLRQMLASPGARIQAFDQDRWAKALNYARRDPRDSVAAFKVLRTSNLALLRSIPRKKWNLFYGMHEERGKESVGVLAQLYAGHDLNHLQQLQRALKR